MLNSSSEQGSETFPPESEEPEDVLVVEPLEESNFSEPEELVGFSDQLPVSDYNFLTESTQASGATATDGLQDSAIVVDTSESPGIGMDFNTPAGTDEITLTDAESGFERIEPDKKSDDFSTDTLAELYISQGFYEKAIDIYERMLLENPHSQGLKDKLSNVRSMASQTESGIDVPTAAQPQSGERASFEEFTPETDITAVFPDTTAQEDFSPQMAAVDGRSVEISETPAREYIPPPDDDLPLNMAADRSVEPEAAAEAREYMPPAEDVSSFDTEFKPVEYVPTAMDATPAVLDAIPPVRQSTLAGRKETIDRLENWLQNIMKEK